MKPDEREHLDVALRGGGTRAIIVTPIRSRWTVRAGEHRYGVSTPDGTVLGRIESEVDVWRAYVERGSRPQPFAYTERDMAIAALVAGSSECAKRRVERGESLAHLVWDTRSACGLTLSHTRAPSSDERTCAACLRAYRTPVSAAAASRTFVRLTRGVEQPIEVELVADGESSTVVAAGQVLGRIAWLGGASWRASGGPVVASRADAIRCLLENSSMTTPRWAALGRSTYGENAREAHYLRAVETAAPCGIEARTAGHWRADPNKPMCATCAQIAEA